MKAQNDLVVLTCGYGIDNNPLLAYHNALCKENLGKFNLVKVSSILPKNFEIMKFIPPMPASIVYTIEARHQICSSHIKYGHLYYALLTGTPQEDHTLVVEWHNEIRIPSRYLDTLDAIMHLRKFISSAATATPAENPTLWIASVMWSTDIAHPSAKLAFCQRIEYNDVVLFDNLEFYERLINTPYYIQLTSHIVLLTPRGVCL